MLHKRRPEKPMHLIGLIDVSGSMQPYARVFLSFIKGLIGTTCVRMRFFHAKPCVLVTPLEIIIHCVQLTVCQ